MWFKGWTLKSNVKCEKIGGMRESRRDSFLEVPTRSGDPSQNELIRELEK